MKKLVLTVWKLGAKQKEMNIEFNGYGFIYVV